MVRAEISAGDCSGMSGRRASVTEARRRCAQPPVSPWGGRSREPRTAIRGSRISEFDTHAAQAASHNLMMIYMSDAIRGFMEDVDRIGRADDVAMIVFTEFGRRVGGNASGGTDH